MVFHCFLFSFLHIFAVLPLFAVVYLLKYSIYFFLWLLVFNFLCFADEYSMMVSYAWCSSNSLQGFFYSLILMRLLVWVSYRVRSFKLMWDYCLITEIFSLWFTHTRRRISDESAILVVFSVVISREDSVACFKASNHPVSVPKLGQRFWTRLVHAWDCWRNLKALIDAWSACH